MNGRRALLKASYNYMTIQYMAKREANLYIQDARESDIYPKKIRDGCGEADVWPD